MKPDTVAGRLRALEAQRDHARALCTWEYFGRPYSEPMIDPMYDDGWAYRVPELPRQYRVHIVPDSQVDGWEA